VNDEILCLFKHGYAAMPPIPYGFPVLEIDSQIWWLQFWGIPMLVFVE